MGLRFFSSSSAPCCTVDGPSGPDLDTTPNASPYPVLSNPNPKRFRILHMQSFRALTVALIRWPDATNYEGTKVLVYRATQNDLLAAAELDPHFCEHAGPLVPIARFIPTDEGVRMAMTFVRLCQ